MNDIIITRKFLNKIGASNETEKILRHMNLSLSDLAVFAARNQPGGYFTRAIDDVICSVIRNRCRDVNKTVFEDFLLSNKHPVNKRTSRFYYLYARFVPEADIKKIIDKIPWTDVYKFGKHVKGVNIAALKKKIPRHANPLAYYFFERDVEKKDERVAYEKYIQDIKAFYRQSPRLMKCDLFINHKTPIKSLDFWDEAMRLNIFIKKLHKGYAISKGN